MVENFKLKLEDLKDMEIQKIQEEMTKNITELQAAVTTMSDEDLKKEEEWIVENLHKKNDEYFKNIEYDLPKSVDFEGKSYKANEVTSMIIQFINRQEVGWSETLGLLQLVKFWKQHPIEKIGYGAYDSTLRILGTATKYKGEQDWRSVLIINDYLTQADGSYVKDTTWQRYVAQLHNVVMQAMQKGDAPNEQAQAE